MTHATQPDLIKHRACFGTNGYLVLPRFFTASEINAAQKTVDRIKRERPMDVIIDDLETGERTVLGLITPDATTHHRLKINDLHLQTAEIRSLALAPKLLAVLTPLFGHVPALCNSLYLHRGSAQAAHVDTLYMTPSTPGHLIASWVALEDADEAAGPLEYFPGSHRIEQMRFSNGSYTAIDAEMGNWQSYMENALGKAGLQKSSFAARKGDVFIWHAHLLHAGGEIADPERTRKSFVFHYFSETDAKQGQHPLVPQDGAFWIDRPPQRLPPRVAAKLPYSEKNYLGYYPDVAEAVRRGAFPNGRAHYDAFGKAEGRSSW